MTRNERVIALWREGEYASVIAAHIGMTRSAVCGVIHRHRLATGEAGPNDRVSVDQKERSPRADKREVVGNSRAGASCSVRKATAPTQEPQPAYVPKLAPPPAGVSYDAPVTVVDLHLTHCRFIVSDQPTMYCGKRATKGSWCEACARIVYVPVKDRKEALRAIESAGSAL